MNKPLELEIVKQDDKSSSMAMMLSPDRMESAMSLARIMATSKVTVPKHLQGQEGDCMAIVLQSMNWGMNPFAVAQKTHLVNGVLGYEAQLVNAVVQSQGFIEGTFQYEYQGDGAALKCRVGAIIRGDKKITWGEWLGVSDVTTKNSPLWKTNPKQQMGYLQVKNWTRAYFPAAILGVYTQDELEVITPEKDVTPESTQTATKPDLDDVTFNEIAKKYKNLVESGKKTLDEFVAWVDGKGANMTASQIETVKSWVPKQTTVIEGEATQVDDPFVTEMNQAESENK